MKYDLTSDFLDLRPHEKGIYIYTCKAVFDFTYSANNLRVMNTFYEKSSYTTWRSFHTTNTCHMLDVITPSFSFSKCIRDFGVMPKGVRSDHSAVQMVFLNRTIKFKSDYVERPVIDWDAIKKIPVINIKFNLLLHKTLQDTHDYTTYNEAILSCAKQTAMIVKSKCQGWFHHSRDTLAPTLESRNEVLHVMRDTKVPASAETLSKLRRLQNKVDEAVGTAKNQMVALTGQTHS